MIMCKTLIMTSLRKTNNLDGSQNRVLLKPRKEREKGRNRKIERTSEENKSINAI